MTDLINTFAKKRLTTRRYYIDQFFFRRAPRLASNSLILDLGGDRLAKRGEFDINRYPVRVITANLSPRKSPNLLANAVDLPFRMSIFDCIICAELFEHVPDPTRVLAEAFRLLRPGGVLLATVPFLYRIHADPSDYARYTAQYWQELLPQVGFTTVEVEPQGFFFSVLSDFAHFYASEIGFPRPFGRLANALVARLMVWAVRRDRLVEPQKDQALSRFTTGFGLAAVKPAVEGR